MALNPTHPSRPRAVALLAEFPPAISPSAFAFQYWPQTMSIARGVNYEGIQIPGGSHPVYQFVSGGDRTINFTAVFSNEQPGVIGRPGIISKYSVDINDAYLALYRFTLPHYELTDQLFTRPPLRAQLILPGTFLGDSSTLPVLVAMTQCDLTYQAWHPDGTPRFATVDLSFVELVSGPNGIKYRDRDDVEPSAVRYGNRVTATVVR